MVNLIVSSLLVVLAAAPQPGEAEQAPAPLISLVPAGETEELRLKELPERSPGSARSLSDTARAEIARYAAAQGNSPALVGGVRKGVAAVSALMVLSGLTLWTVDAGRQAWNGCYADPADYEYLKDLPPIPPPPGGWPPHFCDQPRTMKTVGLSLAGGGIAVWIAGKIHATVVHPQIVWTPGGAAIRGRFSF